MSEEVRFIRFIGAGCGLELEVGVEHPTPAPRKEMTVQFDRLWVEGFLEVEGEDETRDVAIARQDGWKHW